MTSTKSGREGAENNKQPVKTRSVEREQRLAQQLRENLKKRKEFARARKSTNSDGI